MESTAMRDLPTEPQTTADTFDASMSVAWQFNYDIELESLQSLYSKAKQNQWDGEEALDWSVEIDPSKPLMAESQLPLKDLPLFQRLSKSQQEKFTAHSTAQLLSQFLHGEQGALMTAATLTHAVPHYEGKLFAATQTMDEARHVEVYEKYIRKLAIVYPIAPWLKETIDKTLVADHWVKIAIGMNMVVEGLALAAFHNMRRSTTCDLLRSLTEGVLRDEARHVAFGNLYTRESIAEMHADDREDIAQFAFEVVKLMADANGGIKGNKIPSPNPGFTQMLAECDIDPMDFFQSVQEAGMSGVNGKLPPGQIHSFKDLMMPALVRVGAITDRSRELFAAEEIPVWDDLHMLEAFENDQII
ncbi:MAG: ferritin-like domain-containing protein [Candidatus Binatia bacterium]|nr:ferritin-like domain-containing protein [Candidatus Binatia bacterium]MDG1957896.1 ferritin-like domain-containing protein [Candidatus Binatia bacterium]MDG2010671.1 ferritin-like domain-containing protein [Candidatus Binatia bacterium]